MLAEFAVLGGDDRRFGITLLGRRRVTRDGGIAEIGRLRTLVGGRPKVAGTDADDDGTQVTEPIRIKRGRGRRKQDEAAIAAALETAPFSASPLLSDTPEPPAMDECPAA